MYLCVVNFPKYFLVSISDNLKKKHLLLYGFEVMCNTGVNFIKQN